MNTNKDKDKDKEASDYGEPWQAMPMAGFLRAIAIDRNGWGAASDVAKLRAVQCVNACSGMADPAAELEAMREAIKEAHCLLKWTVDSSCGRHHVGVSDALAKLHPFIK